MSRTVIFITYHLQWILEEQQNRSGTGRATFSSSAAIIAAIHSKFRLFWGSLHVGLQSALHLYVCDIADTSFSAES
jgi:hypothetical protein